MKLPTLSYGGKRKKKRPQGQLKNIQAGKIPSFAAETNPHSYMREICRHMQIPTLFYGHQRKKDRLASSWKIPKRGKIPSFAAETTHPPWRGAPLKMMAPLPAPRPLPYAHLCPSPHFTLQDVAFRWQMEKQPERVVNHHGKRNFKMRIFIDVQAVIASISLYCITYVWIINAHNIIKLIIILLLDGQVYFRNILRTLQLRNWFINDSSSSKGYDSHQIGHHFTFWHGKVLLHFKNILRTLQLSSNSMIHLRRWFICYYAIAMCFWNV